MVLNTGPLDWESIEVVETFDIAQKSEVPLRTFSVNVTTSAGNCEFGHVYCRNQKLHILRNVKCFDDLYETFMPFFTILEGEIKKALDPNFLLIQVFYKSLGSNRFNSNPDRNLLKDHNAITCYTHKFSSYPK